jgi:hypothetical protein
VKRRDLFKFFKKGKGQIDGVKVPKEDTVSVESEYRSPEHSMMVEEIISSPDVQQEIQTSAAKHKIDPQNIQLAMVAALGVGLTYSKPANAGIVDTIVGKVVTKFEPLIQSSLGGVFESITGFLDKSAVKQGAAVAGLGDGLNTLQTAIANKKLALDAIPAPGGCEMENWANKTKKLDADLKKAADKRNATNVENLNIAISTNVNDSLMSKFHSNKLSDFISKQEVPTGVSATTDKEKKVVKASVAFSPEKLKPKANATFTQAETADALSYIDTIFGPKTTAIYSVLGNKQKSASGTAVYLRNAQKAHIIEMCKVPFNADIERYAPIDNGSSKQKVRNTFLEDTAFSQVWHDQLKEAASSVPLLKSMVAQQAFTNTILNDLYEQQIVTQKLLSLQLITRSKI